MAENGLSPQQASVYDFNSSIDDPPLPAAEVLIDLKESAKQRLMMQRSLRTSPRKKSTRCNYSGSPKTTPISNRTSSRRLNFSNDSTGYPNNASESSGGEEEVSNNGLLDNKLLKVVSTTPTHKTQTPQASPTKHHRSDQLMLHSVSSRLRNLLKLPKAHKWCYYEWFYSDIDQPLLEGENDFCRCLMEMFPDLKTRSLTRVQWRQLRRLMGKPRRCSPTFFAEERALLEYKRNKVRQLQQQVHQGVITVDNFAQYKDLPAELPALLVVGTSVTARLYSDREHESGFYTGKVEAVDIEKHCYWVTFDRPGLGKHPIPDTEIRGAGPSEVVSISALEASRKSQWPPRDHNDHLRSNTPPHQALPDNSSVRTHSFLSPDVTSDPFLTSSPARRKMLNDAPPLSQATLPEQNTVAPTQVGGFAFDFLKQVTELSKLLQLKQEKIRKLSSMNTELEKLNARQMPVNQDIQRRYALVVIDLDDVNKMLNSRLESIQRHCESLGYKSDIDPTDMTLDEHADKITEECRTSLEASGSGVADSDLVELVRKLTGLLIQIEKLSESGNSLDFTSLTTMLEEIEKTVHPQNIKCFQDHVETPITLIQSGMNPSGTLHAFSSGPIPHRTLSHQYRQHSAIS